MKARLILEDGQIFEGHRFGAEHDLITEIIFTTASTGYVELLTDPSSAGQGIVMATPVVGNYGVFKEHEESSKAWTDAFIIRSLTTVKDDERNAQDLDEYCKQNNIVGLSGVDTRLLIINIREKGTMRGKITSDMTTPVSEILPSILDYTFKSKVPFVGIDKKQVYVNGSIGMKDRNVSFTNSSSEKILYKVALMDFGTKANVPRLLVKRGCEVTLYPWNAKAEEIIADSPDGIVLSNGPGDPKNCGEVIDQMKALYETDIPIFGICLGHQLMALGMGFDTYKLKYGHRGGNCSVKDLKTGRCFVTSQNHSYCVDEKSVNTKIAKVSYIHLDDSSVEGLEYIDKDIFTVQFHPEGAPGPMDSEFLFDTFIQSMSLRGEKN